MLFPGAFSSSFFSLVKRCTDGVQIDAVEPSSECSADFHHAAVDERGALLRCDDSSFATARLRLREVVVARACAECCANAERDDETIAVVLRIGVRHFDEELPSIGSFVA